jgi:putative pantetheine hydrolase
MGEEAYDAALSTTSGAALIGVVGAGTGAAAGGLKGAVGSASVVLADGTTVAALVVVNAFGSCVYPLTGELYAARFGLPGEFTELLLPDADEVAAARAAADTVAVPGRARHAFATTIGVVATDANLTKAQCAKVSGVAHDGMARAIRPVHTMFDGDTVFTMATGDRGAPDPLACHALLDAAGDCFTRAIGRAMLAAESVQTPAGRWRSYRDAFPSAFPSAFPTASPTVSPSALPSHCPTASPTRCGRARLIRILPEPLLTRGRGRPLNLTRPLSRLGTAQ